MIGSMGERRRRPTKTGEIAAARHGRRWSSAAKLKNDPRAMVFDGEDTGGERRLRRAHLEGSQRWRKHGGDSAASSSIGGIRAMALS